MRNVRGFVPASRDSTMLGRAPAVQHPCDDGPDEVAPLLGTSQMGVCASPHRVTAALSPGPFSE